MCENDKVNPVEPDRRALVEALQREVNARRLDNEKRKKPVGWARRWKGRRKWGK